MCYRKICNVLKSNAYFLILNMNLTNFNIIHLLNNRIALFWR